MKINLEKQKAELEDISVVIHHHGNSIDKHSLQDLVERETNSDTHADCPSYADVRMLRARAMISWKDE